MAEVHIDRAALERLFSDPAGPIGQIIEKKCIVVETIAKTLMSIPGSGRFYAPGEYFLTRGRKVYHWTRVSGHRASAPGEPASSDTGRAMSAITHRVKVDRYVYGEVVGNTRYFIYIELGTRFMAPRPVLRPALAAAGRQ